MNLKSSKTTQAGLNVKKIQKYIFKVLVMGDTGVGKTSLVIRSTEGRFPDPSLLKSTIGASFALKKINENENNIVLQLWDFAGQERFRAFMKNLFIGAVAGIFVFDITNPITLDDLGSFWIPAVEDAIKVNFTEQPEVAANFIIVGNKADLSQQRVVSYEEASKFAEKYHMPYIEVSSKTGDGIDEIFQIISKNICKSTRKEKQQ
ncbi:MAG: GTP-binding protein [Candidatus Odinarchaeota archaeon]|nr:GTP-binding protein [Candidatus Odinarchaeota archaeon]